MPVHRVEACIGCDLTQQKDEAGFWLQFRRRCVAGHPPSGGEKHSSPDGEKHSYLGDVAGESHVYYERINHDNVAKGLPKSQNPVSTGST